KQDAAGLRFVRLAGLPVDSHHYWLMTLETQSHDSRERTVDEAQANALAGADGNFIGERAVHSYGIADAPGHRRFHRVTKSGRDLRIRCQTPVRQHPDKVAVTRNRSRLLDDEHARQAAPELPQAVSMRVIPEGPRVGRRESIFEAFAGLDRWLRETGNAVHGVRQPDAVPVDR